MADTKRQHTVQLTVEQSDWLTYRAEAAGVSFNDAVRQALEQVRSPLREAARDTASSTVGVWLDGESDWRYYRNAELTEDTEHAVIYVMRGQRCLAKFSEDMLRAWDTGEE